VGGGGGNIVEPDRPRMAIWSMRIACWIPKAANIHSEFVILIVFTLKQLLHERASLLPKRLLIFFSLKLRNNLE
jgi:hypothetical protein